MPAAPCRCKMWRASWAGLCPPFAAERCVAMVAHPAAPLCVVIECAPVLVLAPAAKGAKGDDMLRLHLFHAGA